MIEVVHHVPAQLLELLPLLQEAVEEAEGEEELPVGPGFEAAAELSFRHQLEQPHHVCFHALQTAAVQKTLRGFSVHIKRDSSIKFRPSASTFVQKCVYKVDAPDMSGRSFSQQVVDSLLHGSIDYM